LLERRRELEVGGRGEDGIRAEHEQQVDAAAAHVVGERRSAGSWTCGAALRRLGIDDRSADVAGEPVHRVRHHVDEGGCPRPRRQAASCAARILRDRLASVRRRGAARCRARRRAASARRTADVDARIGSDGPRPRR
jgi:hypothetical protein